VYDGITYKVKQEAGDRDITAKNIKKSQHINFNKTQVTQLRKVLAWRSNI